ncbi:MAG: DUF4838 domain-containing protein [Kiritimatiellae bacterium]|nr:DUF4838 domain-containing protein [Kiritimatiellia bacterium]
MKNLLLSAGVALTSAAAWAADEPFRMMNVLPYSPGQEARLAREAAAYAENTGFREVLYCLTCDVEGAPAGKKVDDLCASFRKFRNDPEVKDLKVGVLLQAIVGHWPHNEQATEPWTRTRGMEGREGARRCVLDPRFAAYIRETAAKIARERPTFILGDDDIRPFGYVGEECFCDLHVAEFAKRTGRAACTSAEMRELVRGAARGSRDEQVFRSLQREAVNGVCRLIREGIDSVDPGIESGVCLPMAKEEPRFYDQAAKAIAGKGPTLMRVGNGQYLEREPRQTVRRVLSSSAIAELHGDTDYLLDEADTYPQTLWSRSAVGMHAKICMSELCGFRGALPWYVGTSRGAFKVNGEYTRIIAENAGLYRELAKLSRDSRAEGIAIPLPSLFPSATSPIVEDEGWGDKVCAAFGVPFRCAKDLSDKSAIYAVAGEALVSRLADDELKTLLAGKLLLDGAAAEAFVRRGFAKLMGVTVAPGRPPAFVCELAADGTRLTLASSADVASLSGTDPKAVVLTQLANGAYSASPDLTRVAPATTLFTNALGGVVAVTAWKPPLAEGFRGGSLNEARRQWFLGLLAALNGAPLAFVADHEQDVIVQARVAADGARDRRARLLLVSNLGYDPIEKIRLRCAEKPKVVSEIGGDGIRYRVSFAWADGVAVLDRALPCYGVAAFVVGEGNPGRSRRPVAELPPAKWADFHARDLGPVKGEKRFGGSCTVVAENLAKMPIVYFGDNGFFSNRKAGAANYLADCIYEMTGVRPPVQTEDKQRKYPAAPAFFIGDDLEAVKRYRALAEAGLAQPLPTANVTNEEFVVAPREGSYYFLGRGDHGVFDFCERILGVRQYFWEKEGGRFAPKTKGLSVPLVEWRDKPVFAMRSNFPYWDQQWGRYLRDSRMGPVTRFPTLHVHPLFRLNQDKRFNFAERCPDIFELDANGKRGAGLCWCNPRTVEAYKEIIVAGIEKDWPTDGVVDKQAKSVTISLLDQSAVCYCEHCKKVYDRSLGPFGSGSPAMWGYFTAEISKWLAEKYPGWMIVTLPYHNTVICPKGLTFPAGNVTAEMCSMPGLALYKNPETAKHEEDFIRDWHKATGNPVEIWHYSCWPAEFTCAPFVYGKVCQDHFKRLKGVVHGSFLNGSCDESRFALSITAWMKCLWNPDFDMDAFYDGYAKRMYGRAAPQARRVVKLLEDGWLRPWKNNQCSNKNIYEISYPRKEVEEMERVLAEAEEIVKSEDPVVMRRFRFWRKGFNRFFTESAEHASGTGFEPLFVKKAAQPKIDGILDEEGWTAARPFKMVSAHCKTNSVPRDGGEAKAVWTPEGITFGFRCDEHAIEHIVTNRPAITFYNEHFDFMLDPSGEGDDATCQLIVDMRDAVCAPMREATAPEWKATGFKAAFHVDVPKKEWTCEVYIPYSAFKDYCGAKFPTTSANGVVWSGNVTRWRFADSSLPKEQRPPDARREATRIWTRHNWWNKDPTAFGKFVFVE